MKQPIPLFTGFTALELHVLRDVPDVAVEQVYVSTIVPEITTRGKCHKTSLVRLVGVTFWPLYVCLNVT